MNQITFLSDNHKLRSGWFHRPPGERRTILRLIDADRLIEYVKENGVLGNYHSDSERESDVIDMIEAQPTVKEESV